jgi:hypothetical protein
MTDNDNPVNDIMWAAFLQWALGDAQFRDAFTADTGRSFMPAPKSPLAAMIDNATGINKAEVEHFIAWATVRHWGMPFAPVKFAKRVFEMRAAGELPWMTDEDVTPVMDADRQRHDGESNLTAVSKRKASPSPVGADGRSSAQ